MSMRVECFTLIHTHKKKLPTIITILRGEQWNLEIPMTALGSVLIAVVVVYSPSMRKGRDSLPQVNEWKWLWTLHEIEGKHKMWMKFSLVHFSNSLTSFETRKVENKFSSTNSKFLSTATRSSISPSTQSQSRVPAWHDDEWVERDRMRRFVPSTVRAAKASSGPGWGRKSSKLSSFFFIAEWLTVNIHPIIRLCQ